MGRSGDSFNGSGSKSALQTTVQSNTPNWSERIEYMMRAIGGQDIPDKLRAIVWTYNEAIGKLKDKAADATLIAADSTTEASSVALLKASLLQAVAIVARLIQVKAEITGTNVRIDAANITLNEIATQVAGIAVKADDILLALRVVSAPSTIEGSGPQVLTEAGKLAWVRWEMATGATAPRLEIKDGGVLKFASGQLAGEIVFEPPLPIGNYAIRVDPGSAVNAIVNAGVIV
jgi:hypothetical protein